MIDGMPASSSTAMPSGRASFAGHISVRKTAMPKLTGTAIASAIADVAIVPYPATTAP